MTAFATKKREKKNCEKIAKVLQLIKYVKKLQENSKVLTLINDVKISEKMTNTC